MSKRDTLQKIMNVGAGLAGAYFVGIAIAGAIKRKREQQAQGAQGVGATETVLFDNYDNYEYFDEYKQMLLEANDWDDVSDEVVWQAMGDQESEDWWEAIRILLRITGDRSVIAKGTIGTWQGRRNGLNIYRDAEEALQSITKDCDYVKIWQDGRKHTFIKASHHDGTHTLELKALTYDGEDYLDNCQYGNDPRTMNLGLFDIYDRIWNSSKYSKLPKKIEW